MGVREGVLALLEGGPAHGYGLKLGFEAATGGAWELNVGQVYGVLQKLEADELVVFDGEEEGRKRYRITDAGRDRLQEWLTREPIRHTIATRDELSMKILLARCTDIDPRTVISRQRDATMAVLQQHTASKAAAGVEAPLDRLVHLDRLILHCRAELDWLDLLERRLDDRRARDGDTEEGTGT